MSGCPKIEVTAEFEAVVVRIGGVLHIWLDRRKLLGISSWVMTGRRQYFIEFIMDGNTITTDYDSQEKWESILNQVESVLLTGRVT